MKIIITGVETNNKGAELMLYAILQEIERRHPEADVYISHTRVLQGLSYVSTKLKMHFFPYERIVEKLHINGILRRLKLPMIENMNLVKSDYFLDGSGFLFSDQCKLWGTTPEYWDSILRFQKQNGSKIVFLPQAFGPFREVATKRAISTIGKYASLIMAREKVSYSYIKETGLVDMKKVYLFTDFTSLVDGSFPIKYNYLRGGICVIPNMRMIDKGVISYDNYIKLLTAIISDGKKSGRPVYLLNHEGKGDEQLAYSCQESLREKIDVVTGLNALEVKGLIASSYLVITSRFHGLASALNSCVPCLATSWSHKYEELYKDYGLTDCVLPIDNVESTIHVINNYLDGLRNESVRAHLIVKKDEIHRKTKEMWDLVWSI